jgi:S-DNA-T family DNA segregation ATPase FtsK/SpoIIIE
MGEGGDERCAECGFDGAKLSTAGTVDGIRSLARRFRAPLTRFLPGEDGDAVVRFKPDPSTWSALEYACHVRDVLDVYQGRVARTLAENTPTLDSMGRDERALRDRYNEQDPAVVADDLAANGERLASQLDGLTEADWAREAIHPYPEPAARSVLWMVRHVVHEGSHHLLDIGRVLRSARGK